MPHPDITRTPGPFANRSRVVVHRPPGGGGTIWALATARDKTAGVEAQTDDLLASIEGYLHAAGTDKSRLLRAEVFMADLSEKPAMDAAWTRWVPAGEGPVRSAVQTPMPPGDLVEIIVTAALPGGSA
ncbi:RidA family protein [Roseomonas sp. JC162]|uniref:RidA family protein n=1 Tax=Neoroseomonas marina TaxID=1232220 RepID=A0A848EDI7_9PROT|nr:RidA family protein [Neoroseomonas marina]NMJ41523.1 RidA family protein [Neoroseomonas marina]